MTERALSPGERSGIVRDGLAVGLATGAYGIGFGAVSVASGLSVVQTCVLSLVMFTGASQFALVGVVAAGGAPLSGAATALLLGTRNTLYGLRMAPLLKWRGWRRAAAAHVLIDESTAMAVNRPTTEGARLGFTTTGVAVLVLWNVATAIGALAGEAVGDPRAFGLDAAVGAAFLALLWPRLTDHRNVLVAVLGAAVALTMVPLTAAGVPVLAAGGVAVLVGVLSRTPGPDGAARTGRRGGRSPLMWTAIVLACLGCYALKLAGLSLPERVLSHPTVERVADLIPVALLSALVAVQVFSGGSDLTVDARVLGLGFAVVALLLRMPFLVVVVGASVVAALARLA